MNLQTVEKIFLILGVGCLTLGGLLLITGQPPEFVSANQSLSDPLSPAISEDVFRSLEEEQPTELDDDSTIDNDSQQEAPTPRVSSLEPVEIIEAEGDLSQRKILEVQELEIPPVQGLQITPQVKKIDLEPGKRQTGSFQLWSASQQKLYLQAFTALPRSSGDLVYLADYSLAYQADPGSWINFEQNQITIEPEESTTIDFDIVVPLSAYPGQVQVGFFIRSQAISGNFQADTDLMYIMDIQGQVKEELTIQEFTTDRSFYEYGPTKFIVQIQNTGNTWLQPQAEIWLGAASIKDSQDAQAILPVWYDQTVFLLPGAIRSFEIVWRDNFLIQEPLSATLVANSWDVALADSGATLNLEGDFSGLKIGPYEAILAVSFQGDQQHLLQSSTKFWIVPWRLMLISFGSFLLIMSVFMGIVGWFLKRRQSSFIQNYRQALGGSKESAKKSSSPPSSPSETSSSGASPPPATSQSASSPSSPNSGGADLNALIEEMRSKKD